MGDNLPVLTARLPNDAALHRRSPKSIQTNCLDEPSVSGGNSALAYLMENNKALEGSPSTAIEKPRRGRPRLGSTNSGDQSERRRAQVRAAQKTFHLRNNMKLARLQQRVTALEDIVNRMNDMNSALMRRVATDDVMGTVPALGRDLLKMTLDLQQIGQRATFQPQDAQNQNPWGVSQTEDQISNNSSSTRVSHDAIRDLAATHIAPNMAHPLHAQNLVIWETSQLGSQPAQIEEYPSFTEDQSWKSLDQSMQWPMINIAPNPILTYSFHETSFGRRLHRACSEHCFRLVTSGNVSPEQLNQKLGFSLMINSLDRIIEKAQQLFRKTTADSLWNEDEPVFYLGNNYTKIGSHIINTVYNGEVKQTQHPPMPGLETYDGKWYNPYELERYLYQAGILSADLLSKESIYSIPLPPLSSSHGSSSDIARDLFSASKHSTNSSSISGDSSSTTFPHFSASPFFESPFSAIQRKAIVGQDILSEEKNSYETSDATLVPAAPLNIDLEKLVELLVEYSTCLGRSPGFRASDVHVAIQKARIQVD